MKYVVELARALANTKGIYRVDLLTRQIASPVEVDSGYGKPIEICHAPLMAVTVAEHTSFVFHADLVIGNYHVRVSIRARGFKPSC